MKKTLLVLLTSISVLGYTQEKKGYIGLSLGFSTPTGDFVSKNIDNDAAGFANSGVNFNLSFAYKLKGNFGITAMLHSQAHSIDAQAFVDDVAKENPGTVWSLESGSWSISGLMVGGYGSFPISEKVSFDTRLMMGFLTAKAPTFRLSTPILGTEFWVEQDAGSASSFAYLLGAGFKFDLGNKVSLLTNLDYIGSNPEFNDVKITDSLGGKDTNSFKQSMGSVNLSVGIALRI